MTKTKLTHKSKHGFKGNALHVKRDPRGVTMQYMRQKTSFLVAAVALVAGLAGNMIGSHGFHAFVAALGKVDDSLIVYTGTVPPIAKVPDYKKWAKYGGNGEVHTFDQVPADDLISLPTYNDTVESKEFIYGTGVDYYSVGNMGSYLTGAAKSGSHPGTDIDVPEGTPVQSVMAGIVTQVREDKGGYGLLIVIRHPNVPSPENPKNLTVLHSAYAHLSKQVVAEGDIVQKGQLIGYSGKTGNASGPHLHFQIDRDKDADGNLISHPYWPFTWQDQRNAGLTFTAAVNSTMFQSRLRSATIDPMLYVQANYSAPTTTVVKNTTTVAASTIRTGSNLKDRVAAAKASRLAKRGTTVVAADTVIKTTTVTAAAEVIHTAAPVASSSSSSMASVSSSSSVASVSTAPMVSPCASTVKFELSHRGYTKGREWLTAYIQLKDQNGNDIAGDCLTQDIQVRAAYGAADFKQSTLSSIDFDSSGRASFQVRALGESRSIVLGLQPGNVMFLDQPIKVKD